MAGYLNGAGNSEGRETDFCNVACIISHGSALSYYVTYNQTLVTDVCVFSNQVKSRRHARMNDGKFYFQRIIIL
jgi:hypothetical protein